VSHLTWTEIVEENFVHSTNSKRKMNWRSDFDCMGLTVIARTNNTSCRFRQFYIYAKAITRLHIYRSQQGWQQCLCKSPRSNAAITQFHPGCGEITILYTASLLLTFSGSHTPSIPPEAFLRSSYISSIIGFHSRTRALMNQLETCQCKWNRCIRIYIFLVRVAEI